MMHSFPLANPSHSLGSWHMKEKKAWLLQNQQINNKEF
jgi:hypothetical protein